MNLNVLDLRSQELSVQSLLSFAISFQTRVQHLQLVKLDLDSTTCAATSYCWNGQRLRIAAHIDLSLLAKWYG